MKNFAKLALYIGIVSCLIGIVSCSDNSTEPSTYVLQDTTPVVRELKCLWWGYRSTITTDHRIYKVKYTRIFNDTSGYDYISRYYCAKIQLTEYSNHYTVYANRLLYTGKMDTIIFDLKKDMMFKFEIK